MSERYTPTPPEIKQAEEMMTAEQKEKSNLRERMLEAVKSDVGSYNNIVGAREVGIPEKTIKEYALRFMAADLRREAGYENTLKMLYRIARNAKVATDKEVHELAKEIYTDIINQDPSNADAAKFFGIAPVVDLKQIKLAKEKEKEVALNRLWSIIPESEDEMTMQIELTINATMADLFEALDSGESEYYEIEEAFNEDLSKLGKGIESELSELRFIKIELAAKTKVADFFKKFGNTKKDIETWLPIMFKKSPRKKK